jgi:hypothetical protein
VRVSSIYLRQGDRLLEMRERPYEAETVLQELLADHPELLHEGGGGLLLVRREARVSDGGRQLDAGWLDHLFLDAEGVPTLVEVKRSSDGRLRREVVGQMLDYAANAVSGWPEDTLREWFAESCAPADPEATLLDAFPQIEDVEGYWSRVRANLSAGRLRLVFVADAIPARLQRIVEFLNGQMQQAEVLAIEVRQYADEQGEVQTLVPRVLGQTAAAQQAKGRRSVGRWDRESILRDLRERHDPQLVAVAEALFAWADARGLVQWFGSGIKDGSFQAGVQDGTRYLWPFALFTYGRIEVRFEYIARRPPFSDVRLREQLRAKLNEIPGVQLDAAQVELRPGIDLGLLAAPAARERFLAAMDWCFEQVASSGEQ